MVLLDIVVEAPSTKVPNFSTWLYRCMAVHREALLAWCADVGILIDDRLVITSVPFSAESTDDDMEWHAEPGAMAVVAQAPIPAGDSGRCHELIQLFIYPRQRFCPPRPAR